MEGWLLYLRLVLENGSASVIAAIIRLPQPADLELETLKAVDAFILKYWRNGIMNPESTDVRMTGCTESGAA
jgi:hypothetical protein